MLGVRCSLPLPMGFPHTSPADQSVRRPHQCLLFGTDPEAGPENDDVAIVPDPLGKGVARHELGGKDMGELQRISSDG